MQRPTLRKHTAAKRMEYAAIAAARRNNAALYYVPKNLAGIFTPNTDTTQAGVGSLLGYWRDSQYGIGGVTGVGVPMIRLSTATRPTIVQLSNGRYAVSFNGTDQCISAATLNAGSVGTLIAAGTPSAVKLQTFVGNGGQSAVVAGTLLGLDATPAARFNYGSLATTGNATAGAYAVDVPILLSSDWTLTTKRLRVNGSLVATTSDAIDATSTLGTAIGRDSTTVAGEFFAGSISLVCIAPVVLSDEDRKIIERFAAYQSGAEFVG